MATTTKFERIAFLNRWKLKKYSRNCELNAFKYRMRMGEKPEQPIDRDLEKEKWYINKANELRK